MCRPLLVWGHLARSLGWFHRGRTKHHGHIFPGVYPGRVGLLLVGSRTEGRLEGEGGSAPLLGGVVSAGAWPQPVCGLAGPGLTWGHRPLITLFALQPFRCAHCHYSCNISGSLKRHYNRKHPNEEYANVGAGELAADALVQQGK